ncbi:MAG: sulfurase [Phycisphaerae bacterium]
MQIVSVNTGRPILVVHGDRRYSTGINKRPADGRVRLEVEGFLGDRVADSENHGGLDKAACCYSYEHYPYWQNRVGADLPVPSFGENLTTAGLLESSTCIGDTLRIGSALVQVSQPRQPCWKLANKLSTRELPRWIMEQAFTGFYVRVLEPGGISAGDEASLLERPQPELTVARVAEAVLLRQADRDLFTRLATLPELSEAWRQRAAALGGA